MFVCLCVGNGYVGVFVCEFVGMCVGMFVSVSVSVPVPAHVFVYICLCFYRVCLFVSDCFECNDNNDTNNNIIIMNFYNKSTQIETNRNQTKLYFHHNALALVKTCNKM